MGQGKKTPSVSMAFVDKNAENLPPVKRNTGYIFILEGNLENIDIKIHIESIGEQKYGIMVSGESAD
jgi:hypothetical protein